MTKSFKLPDSITVSLQRDAGEFDLPISELTVETVLGLIAAGFRETTGNAGGSPKENETATDAVLGCAARIISGEFSFGGGGGGRLSPTIAVAREWVAQALVANKAAKNRTEAAKMVREDLAGSYEAVVPEGDYEAFLADAKAEADRRAKNANPLAS